MSHKSSVEEGKEENIAMEEHDNPGLSEGELKNNGAKETKNGFLQDL